MALSTTGVTDANTTGDTPATDPRRAAFDLTAAGIIAGLPIPRFIGVGEGISHVRLELHLCDNDTHGVNRWAAWLGLPAPAMTLKPISTSARNHATGWFQPYEAQSLRHAATGGWVIVKSYLDVDAPADVEQAEVTA